MRSAPQGSDSAIARTDGASQLTTQKVQRLLRPRTAVGRQSLLRDDRGTVTAEFAITLPVVLIVLGLVVGGVGLSAHRIALISVAAETARLEARGGAAEARERLASLSAGVSVQREMQGDLHCVLLSSSPGSGLLASISLNVRACAAVSDTVGVQ